MGPIKEALEQAGLTDVAIEPAQPTWKSFSCRLSDGTTMRGKKGKRKKAQGFKGHRYSSTSGYEISCVRRILDRQLNDGKPNRPLSSKISPAISGNSRRWTTSALRSHLGRSSASWDPTGRANPPPSACSTACLLPTSGEGRVGGFDIIRENAQIKNHIGYMSQRFSLYEDLTGEENLTFFGGVYGLNPGPARRRASPKC